MEFFCSHKLYCLNGSIHKQDGVVESCHRMNTATIKVPGQAHTLTLAIGVHLTPR